SYRFIENWSGGFEFLNEHEYNSFTFKQESNSGYFLGPVIHYGGERFFVTVTALWQMPWASAHSDTVPGALVGGFIGDNDFERFRLRVKAGYTFSSEPPPVTSLKGNDMKAQWAWLPLAVISTSAYATTYLSVEQAQRAIFPGLSFTTTAQPGVWRTSSGGVFIVDKVVGKHEYITVAIGINPNRTVKQIEIMEYGESYGYEVRDAAWRAQFVGKSVASPLISRISAAPRCRRNASLTASNASCRNTRRALTPNDAARATVARHACGN